MVSSFDLRITMTDTAGNSQTQVISPAFKLAGGAGTDINVNDPDLRVIDGKVVLSDDSEPMVFSISGERVRNESLQPGIYIVKTAARTSKLIVK